MMVTLVLGQGSSVRQVPRANINTQFVQPAGAVLVWQHIRDAQLLIGRTLHVALVLPAG